MRMARRRLKAMRNNKTLEEMNILERVFALLVGADTVYIIDNIKEDGGFSVEYVDGKAGLEPGGPPYTHVYYRYNPHEEIAAIGYLCPVCKDEWIENYVYNCRDEAVNCNQDPILIDAPMICYKCANNELAGTGLWYDYGDLVFEEWTEEELAALPKEVDEGNG
jgi:hypothetical protein